MIFDNKEIELYKEIDVLKKKINNFANGFQYQIRRFDRGEINEVEENDLFKLIIKYKQLEKENKFPKDNYDSYNRNFGEHLRPLFHSDTLLKINELVGDNKIDINFIKFALRDLISPPHRINKISYLKNFKSNFEILSLLVNEACNIKINEIEKLELETENNPKKFIEKIDPELIINKKELAGLCGMGETWIHNNKKNFNQIPQGVYLQDFLKWLFISKPKTFDEFKKNWLERLNTQKN